jgi:hypothetical protein
MNLAEFRASMLPRLPEWSLSETAQIDFWLLCVLVTDSNLLALVSSVFLYDITR